MSALGVIAVVVLVLGAAGLVRAMWPTKAERSYGYPNHSPEARDLLQETHHGS